jgi:hypothetical protein
MRRWSLWLMTVNVIAAGIFVVSEETRKWPEFMRMEQYDEAQRQSYLHASAEVKSAMTSRPKYKASGDSKPIEIDYWPSNNVRGVYMLNLPAVSLVGWYKHSISGMDDRTLLGPVLAPIQYRLRLGPRIIAMDLLMLSLIAAQWWSIGKLLESTHTAFWKILAKLLVAMSVTFAGFAFLWTIPGIGHTKLLGQVFFWMYVPAIPLTLFTWVACALLVVANLANSFKARLMRAAKPSETP